ncbi:ArsR/SmtB family transcription factor [Aminipila sp.]|uniref:ArsR/SmtB family transcription factor n=1 Tax=Aminipila sp. TaxID=2060095 RepID=UPI000EC7260D|nr:metalloregulator ArsR/SmtB family transcription factor [Aminipila sp.]HCX60923.1 transcriptional regulator [Clostridiales bacterium]
MLDILKALADETRLRIISQILKSEMCVCEIEECLGLTQSNASRHLTVLKKAGVLDSYKNAQWTYYKVSDEFLRENKELYDYLIKKISKLPCYINDCDKFNECKIKGLCDFKN